jgi:hypothetical protein
MQNKANFGKSQMFITLIPATGYSEKHKLDTWSKQTQTKPILKSVIYLIYKAEGLLRWFHCRGGLLYSTSRRLIV